MPGALIMNIWRATIYDMSVNKGTYLVSLDSTCMHSKMQANAILVRRESFIVSLANETVKGNVLIDASLGILGTSVELLRYVVFSKEDSCG